MEFLEEELRYVSSLPEKFVPGSLYRFSEYDVSKDLAEFAFGFCR